jgi:hypothetical protein
LIAGVTVGLVARPQPAALMQEAGFDRRVGAENICENITAAWKRAETIHAEKPVLVSSGVSS